MAGQWNSCDHLVFKYIFFFAFFCLFMWFVIKVVFKRKEREILQQLEAQEDNTAEIHETFSNLRQEVEIKTGKLKKLYSKLQQACFFLFIHLSLKVRIKSLKKVNLEMKLFRFVQKSMTLWQVIRRKGKTWKTRLPKLIKS